MESKYKTLDELKDSRILFEKKFPAMGYILLLVISIFTLSAIIWSIRTPKLYMVKAQGTVTNEKANYVMCSYTGQIKDCNMEEGKIVEKGDELFVVTSDEYDVQKEQLEQTRKFYEQKIKKNKLLVKSIKDNVNYFDPEKEEDTLYYSTFETYKAQVEQNSVSKKTYHEYGYTDKQIKVQQESNEKKNSELYYSAIQSAESAISDAQMQIETIDAQVNAVDLGKKDYVVKATASGVLHMLKDYKDGMVVQTTQSVAVIMPENEKYVIEAYVSTADVVRIHKNDDVRVTIDGLTQNVYGAVTGKVKQIASNVTMQEENNGMVSPLFRILIEPERDYLLTHDGEKIDLSNGMTAEAYISYDKETYFNYILEKMGVNIR